MCCMTRLHQKCSTPHRTACVIPTRRCAWSLQLWRRVEHMKFRSAIAKWCQLVAEENRLRRIASRLMSQHLKLFLTSAFNSWHESCLHQVLPIETEILRKARAQRAWSVAGGCCASRSKHATIKQVNTTVYKGGKFASVTGPIGESWVRSTLQCALPVASVKPVQLGNCAWP